MSVLLDTSVVIALIPAARERADRAAVSVVTLGELRAGVLLARNDEARAMRRNRLHKVRASFAALAVDEQVAERYGDILAVARHERRIAKATDLLIIAGAAASGRTLLTLDDRQAELASAAGVETSSEL